MKRQKPSNVAGRIMAKIVAAKMHPELHALLAERAEKEGIPMGEYLVRLAAVALGRDELAVVPRKPLGRRAVVAQ